MEQKTKNRVKKKQFFLGLGVEVGTRGVSWLSVWRKRDHLFTWEAIWVLLHQKVGGNVTLLEARLANDVAQQRNVVLDTCGSEMCEGREIR